MVVENLSSTVDYELYDYEDYYYEYDPSSTSISMEELVVPLLVYSITFIIGLVGNILILVAVRGQKQVSLEQMIHLVLFCGQEMENNSSSTI